jgi:hypothetical protein
MTTSTWDSLAREQCHNTPCPQHSSWTCSTTHSLRSSREREQQKPRQELFSQSPLQSKSRLHSCISTSDSGRVDSNFGSSVRARGLGAQDTHNMDPLKNHHTQHQHKRCLSRSSKERSHNSIAKPRRSETSEHSRS